MSSTPSPSMRLASHLRSQSAQIADSPLHAPAPTPASQSELLQTLLTLLQALQREFLASSKGDALFDSIQQVKSGTGLLDLCRALDDTYFHHPSTHFSTALERLESVRSGVSNFFQTSLDTTIDWSTIHLEAVASQSQDVPASASSLADSSSASELFKFLELVLLFTIHSEKKEEVVHVIMQLSHNDQAHLMSIISDAQANYLPHLSADLGSPNDGNDFIPDVDRIINDTGKSLQDTPNAPARAIDSRPGTPSRYRTKLHARVPKEEQPSLQLPPPQIQFPVGRQSREQESPSLPHRARSSPSSSISGLSHASLSMLHQPPGSSPTAPTQRVLPPLAIGSALSSPVSSIGSPSPVAVSSSSHQMPTHPSSAQKDRLVLEAHVASLEAQLATLHSENRILKERINSSSAPAGSSLDELQAKVTELSLDNAHLREAHAKLLAEETALHTAHAQELQEKQAIIDQSIPFKKHQETVREHTTKLTAALYKSEEQVTTLTASLAGLEQQHQQAHLDTTRSSLRIAKLEEDLSQLNERNEVLSIQLAESKKAEQSLVKLKAKLESLSNLKLQYSELQSHSAMLEAKYDEVYAAHSECVHTLQPQNEAYREQIVSLQSENRDLKLKIQTDEITKEDLAVQLQTEKELNEELRKQVAATTSLSPSTKRASPVSSVSPPPTGAATSTAPSETTTSASAKPPASLTAESSSEGQTSSDSEDETESLGDVLSPAPMRKNFSKTAPNTPAVASSTESMAADRAAFVALQAQVTLMESQLAKSSADLLTLRGEYESLQRSAEANQSVIATTRLSLVEAEKKNTALFMQMKEAADHHAAAITEHEQKVSALQNELSVSKEHVSKSAETAASAAAIQGDASHVQELKSQLSRLQSAKESEIAIQAAKLIALEAQLATVQQQSDRITSESSTNLQAMRKELNELRASNESKDEAISTHVKQVDALNLQLSQVKDSQASETQQQLDAVQKELVATRTNVQAKDIAIQAHEKHVEELKAQLSQATESESSLQQQLEQAASTTTKLELRQKDVQKELDELRVAIQTKDEAINKHSQEVDELKQQLEQAINSRAELQLQSDQDASGRASQLAAVQQELQVLQTAHSAKEELIQSHEKQVEELKLQLSQATTSQSTLQQQSEGASEASAKLEAVQKELEELRASTVIKDETIESHEKQVQELNLQLTQATEQHTQALSTAESKLAEAEGKVAAIQLELAELRQSSGASSSETNHNDLEQQLSDLKQQHVSDIAQREEQHAALNESLTQAREELQRGRDESEKRVQALEKELMQLREDKSSEIVEYENRHVASATKYEELVSEKLKLEGALELAEKQARETTIKVAALQTQVEKAEAERDVAVSALDNTTIPSTVEAAAVSSITDTEALGPDEATAVASSSRPEELAEVRAQLAECEQRLSESQAALDTIRAQLTAAESTIAATESQLLAAEASRSSAESKLIESESRLASTQRALQNQTNQNGDITNQMSSLHESYSSLHESYSELQQEFGPLRQDLADRTSELAEAQRIAEEQASLVHEAQEREARLVQQLDALSHSHAPIEGSLSDLQQNLRAKEAEVAFLHAEKDEIVARHKADLEDMNLKLLRVKQDRDKLMGPLTTPDVSTMAPSLPSSTTSSNTSSPHVISLPPPMRQMRNAFDTPHSDSHHARTSSDDATLPIPRFPTSLPNTPNTQKIQLMKNRLSAQSRELLALKKERISLSASIADLEKEKLEAEKRHEKELLKAFDALNALQVVPIAQSALSPTKGHAHAKSFGGEETLSASKVNAMVVQKQMETLTSQLHESQKKFQLMSQHAKSLQMKYAAATVQLNSILRGPLTPPLSWSAVQCREEMLERERIHVEQQQQWQKERELVSGAFYSLGMETRQHAVETHHSTGQ